MLQTVEPGEKTAFDESRIGGWYNSPITCGLEPKPIRTGAMLHLLCVAVGKLLSYKLHVRTYGGKNDKDLDKKSIHTQTIQKWINLLDELLNDFRGRDIMTP